MEAGLPLRYLAAFSGLGSGASGRGPSAVLAWGANRRGQLGLPFGPGVQLAPVPLLALEGVRVCAVASHESHAIFLTEEGHLWTCGAGFSGLLGHGGLEDCAQPRLLEPLAHKRAVAVAAGARHSAAVTSDGQVYTWGAADLGQLGHGFVEAGGAAHVLCHDPTTGGEFAYLPVPALVRALADDGAAVVAVACCSYSTLALTDAGHVYSWGNNTDGQCGLGQHVPGERTVTIDRHMARTALKVVATPRRVASAVPFRALSCGGYHALAIDREGSVWSWGQGMWGKLGHGDIRSMYEPKVVEALEHRGANVVAAGRSHSVCLCSLYRLTVSSGVKEKPLSPFTLLGLPVGKVNKHALTCAPLTPPGTSLQLRAFVCAPLMSVGLPFRFEPGVSQVNAGSHGVETVRDSVVLVDRGLAQGVWLKLATTDFDFSVKMAATGAQVPTRQGLTGDVMTATEGMYVADTDCKGKLCVIELPEVPNKDSPGTDPIESVVLRVLNVARGCQSAGALACVCALPPGCDLFRVQVSAVLQAGLSAAGAAAASRASAMGHRASHASAAAGRASAMGRQASAASALQAGKSSGSLGVSAVEAVRSSGSAAAAGGAPPMPLGFLDEEHGALLRKHLARLVAARLAEAPGGVPEEVRGWRRGQEEFSGKPFWERQDTGERRETAPLVGPGAMASLVVVREECLAERLQAVAKLQPKAIVLCQQSWRPDPEPVALPEFEGGWHLQVPIACVTYEAAEELKRLERGRAGAARLWVTMEVQEAGAVFAWGDGTMGQLGLGGIAHGSLLTHTANSLTNEEHSFASLPRYVSSLHEEQVTALACGAQHTLAANNDGEVFSWGQAEGLGATVSDDASSEVPVLVDHLEGHFRATRVFAGHDHSFAVAESSVQSVI
ncbi:unnamed protein product [Prorocentrum cordatum]|uniref:RCC1-like domain-containing protein n=1 Tax=Prorocentrum cordatum TaxID=2364126 RepID=A0ABN9UT42_9DINO|nr:unnamed protein product [Polarella glacialis]